MNPRQAMRLFVIAGAALGALASGAKATPLDYTLLTYIPVPADTANVQPGGAFSSFDISFAESPIGPMPVLTSFRDPA